MAVYAAGTLTRVWGGGVGGGSLSDMSDTSSHIFSFTLFL